MAALLRRTAPLAPAALVLAFAASLGTFPGAAGGVESLAAHLLLFAVLALTLPGVEWRGAAPAVTAWLAVALACWASPVPRAGTTALAMLPAFLALPAAVARWWRGEAERTAGLRALAAVLAAVSAWALLAWRLEETPGASLPLGHHNLLASWLVILLPLVAGAWRRLGAALAAPAALLALAALLATGSLAGLVAATGSLSYLALAWSLGASPRRGRRLLLACALALSALAVLAALRGERIAQVLAGEDASFEVRRGYVEAAWRGALERPWLGWGPGAAHWTLAEHLRPVPGVHPPGEVVADAHNLPLQGLYELGLVGAGLLVLALVVQARGGRGRGRGRGGSGERDEPLVRAARASLLAAVLVSLGGLDLSVTAVPVALAVAFGAHLAAGGRREEHQEGHREGHGEERSGRIGPWPAAVLVALLASWQLPRDLAHLDYDRARHAGEPSARLEALAAAVAKDPSMPLYRWRLALETGDPGDARRAAESARGLAAPWLTAGRLAEAAGDLRAARDAWSRACELDPLGAVGSFRLAAAAGGELAVERGARALLASPELLAATSWPPALRALAAERVLETEGVDAGWRLALADLAASLEAEAELDREAGVAPATVYLALRLDVVGGESMSLFAFRRRPWPAVLETIALDRLLLELVDLPAAVSLDTTRREVLRSGCRLGGGG